MRHFSFSKSLFLALTLFLTACGGSYGGGGNNGGGGGGTAPGAPTGLTATAGDTQVALAWTAVSGATSYHVKRSTTSGSGYTQTSAPTGTNFTDTGLTDGTTYYYVVSAVNAYGESANSTEKSASPVAPIVAPAAPTGLTTHGFDSATVELVWNSSTGATSYTLKRSATSGGPYTTVATRTWTALVDSPITAGNTYFYVVSASNSAGESANSVEVQYVNSPLAPQVPTGLVAAVGNTQVTLNWAPSGNATSYHVKRSTTNGGGYVDIGTPTTTSFNDSGLTNGTTYYYVVSAQNSVTQTLNSSQVSAVPSATPPDVTINTDTAPSHRKSISSYIYGINSYSGVPNPPHVTFDRAGGNRWTAYNWENNFSNAGNDFGPYHSDTFLSSSTTPAEAVRVFIDADHAAGLASLMTVQLQGYVAADANGNVDTTQPLATRLAARFKQVVDKKGSAFILTPPTTDAFVYMDEFLWALDQKFTGDNIFAAGTAQPTFVSLDNEPELWSSTHLEVQGPTPVTSDDYINKTITLTKAMKDHFPGLVVFGPVHYGFLGIYNWQSELNSSADGWNWFPDKYLQQISIASAAYGKPLVDVYDFHWYPEVYDVGSTRITAMSGTSLTDTQVQQIVQAPRDLWDPTWHDPNNSNPWVYQTLNSKPIRMLRRLQTKLQSEFPGMKLSVTEYECGGWNHIAGTVAQADALGIFATEGVFAANLWPPSGTYDYALAGFRAFRGYDGANANFGDTLIPAASSSVQDVTAYMSTDSSSPGTRLVMVVINKSNTAKVTQISDLPVSGTANVYQMTATSASGQTPVHPLPLGTMASGSSLTLTLPALSVTTIEVK